MNVVKKLVDIYNCSKYSLCKDLDVSWNTVHMWYLGIFEPTQINKEKIYEKLREEECKKEA